MAAVQEPCYLGSMQFGNYHQGQGGGSLNKGRRENNGDRNMHLQGWRDLAA